ncbi:DUF4138 domain-containing protein [Chryseobacterium oryzae]|uniref:Conjugative transposon protein TraN n=1 Tax=Chryseobacterium oryzae TaxID=2929799 RepID=A0ABY4BPL4_9FLAO|nr:DUF4138 domain-containing protein [Chryseobacterium oryzae]UOE39658.1 conjugative transposon protein TraN [Chryseobacterium oryzae]
MKRVLIVIGMLAGFYGYSQKSTQNIYKKPVQKSLKKTVSNKAVTPIMIDAPVEQSVEKVAEKNEQKADNPEQYEIIAQKIIKKNGWIKNRNSAFVRGIEGFVKGVYVGSGKVYVLIEVANRTNISYDVESISFITSPVQFKDRQIEAEEKIFSPIYAIQTESIAKKSREKLLFVFDKFTISDNKNLLFIMSEIDGERTISLDIKPKYIIAAEYVK